MPRARDYNGKCTGKSSSDARQRKQGDGRGRLRPAGGFVSAAGMAHTSSCSRGSRFAWRAALLAVLAAGCAGSPIPAPIEGEPVCPDFQSRGVLMAGGLRYPVRVRVLEGKTVLYRTILPGLRASGGKQPSTYIVDDNAEYTVEWAQCENERAPHPATSAAHEQKARSKLHEDEGAGYECGEGKIYKQDKLVTRKHDAASHVIKFVPPPNPACWEGEAPAAPAADTGAPGAGPVPTPSGSPAEPPPPPAPPPAPTPAPSK
jgi:hypothetical protein